MLKVPAKGPAQRPPGSGCAGGWRHEGAGEGVAPPAVKTLHRLTIEPSAVLTGPSLRGSARSAGRS
eukprot:10655420-Heterocapsa_arctica.AAC.1